MELNWIVTYEDETMIYEDGYSDEKTAKEYYEEAVAEGYKNASYFKAEKLTIGDCGLCKKKSVEGEASE